MKHFLLLLFCSSIGFISEVFGQTDTLYLSIDEVSAPANQQVCVPIQAKNFNKIVALQLAFHWDETLLSLDTIRNISLTDDRSLLFSNNEPGLALTSWNTIQGLTIPDGQPVFELCFTSLTDAATLVPIEIKPTSDFFLEAIHENIISIPIRTEQGVFIAPVVVEDCDVENLCITSLAVNFDQDTVEVWPEDLLRSSLMHFKECFNVKDEDIFVINLSSIDAQPVKSAKFYCGNLRDTVHVGFTVRTVDTEDYWVFCKVPIFINNIPEESCKMNQLSPSDPAICRDVNIEATSSRTVIGPENLLDLSSNPDETFNYSDSENDWWYTVTLEQQDLIMECSSYNQISNRSTNLIVAEPGGGSETQKIVVQDFCTHEIQINAENDVCGTNVDQGEIEVRVANIENAKPVDFFVNDVRLENTGNGSYKLNQADLVEVDNIISFGDVTDAINEPITSLDLVFMLKALRGDETLDSHQAIAADADRSGSLTTSDLIIIWETILGFRDYREVGAYITPSESEMPLLDYLDFDNTFEDYRFDRNELDAETGLDLVLGLIGDVSKSKSFSTKNGQQIEFVYEDRFVEEGELIDLSLQVEKNNNNPIIGMFVGIDESAIDVIDMTVNSTHSSTLIFDIDEEYRFSYMNIDNNDILEINLQVSAKISGRLSELIKLSDYNHEVVTADDVVYSLNLMGVSEVIDFQVSPNPTDGMFTIDIPQAYQGGEIEISNVIGKIIYQENIAEDHKIMTKDELPGQGVYVIRLSNGDLNTAKKLFVR